MAWISSSLKPLAILSMTVEGRVPARNSCIAFTMAAGSRPTSRGTGEATPGDAAWQPEQAPAPAGGAAEASGGHANVNATAAAAAEYASLIVFK